MYQFATAQETSTVKLQAFFMRYKRVERIPRDNKSKITTKNTFNGHQFDVKGNYK